MRVTTDSLRDQPIKPLWETYPWKLEAPMELSRLGEMVRWLKENATGKWTGCGLIETAMRDPEDYWSSRFITHERVRILFEKEEDLLMFKLMFAESIR